MKVRVQRIKQTAILPTRGSAHAAGYDLYAAETVTIPGCRVRSDGAVEIGRAAVSTGLIIEIPSGFYGRISPRSGLALRHGIDTLAGVVDSDYRAEVLVLLANFGAEPFVVEQGRRCAQIIFEQVGMFALEEAEELSATTRATGGFGSTGVD